jgi:hypothetical protein
MRFLPTLRLVIAAIALFLACAMPLSAREFVSTVEELEHLPVTVTGPIVPTDPNMLFYLQRSTSSNTVVYAAKFAKPGQLDPNNAVEVFWRRYTENGERKGLNFLERTMAYGASSKPVPGHPNAFDAKIVSLPEIIFRIALDENGKPEASVQMGNRRARVVFAYIKVDDSGLIPKFISLDIYGYDKATGRALHEHKTESKK